MPGDEPHELERRRRVDRERVVRTLTFWMRPEFVLRVVNRDSTARSRWLPAR